MYQGKRIMRGYFEGWYYKFADIYEQNIGALIPGVSFDKKGNNSHSFIQYLDDSGSLSNYFLYDIKEFSYSPDKPEIKIGKSFFSPTRIEVDIDDKSSSIKGALSFRDIKPWPVSFFSPGAMGWYAFVPFMECYHGVLSFNHLIEVQLKLNGKSIDFNGGKGYIEKDWGRSFPSYHIWIQSNHFDEPGISLMVSIAKIPWLGKSFNGFLIGLLYNGHLYKFTTSFSLFRAFSGVCLSMEKLLTCRPVARCSGLYAAVAPCSEGVYPKSLQAQFGSCKMITNIVQ